MSMLMSALPTMAPSQTDFLIIDQGSPGITRRAYVSFLGNLSAASVGQIPPTHLPYSGARKISQLPIAATAYLNDTILLDQGKPTITRRATLAQMIAASGSGPVNSGLVSPPSNRMMSEVALASSVYLDDWVLINTGNPPTTKRAQVGDVLNSAGIGGGTSIFAEDFEHGLGNWPTVVGNSAFFTLASSPFAPLTPPTYSSPGSCINTASGAFGQNVSRLTISFPAFTQIEFKFNVPSTPAGVTSNSGSGVFTINNVGGVLSFFPRSPVSFDPSSRPLLILESNSLLVGSSSLSLANWYRCVVKINAGSGNSTLTLYNLSGGVPGTLVGTYAIPGVCVPIANVINLSIGVGVPGVTPYYQTQFDDIILKL